MRLPPLPTPYSLLPIFKAMVQRSSILCLLVASLMLSGCVRYDMGLQFSHSNQGAIVQHIQLGERFNSLNGTTVQQWFDAVHQRTRHLGGRVKTLSEREFIVTIPFSSSADLEAKFNQFFNPADFNAAETELSFVDAAAVPKIESRLAMSRSNFLLVERNRLDYSLDLRSLGVSAGSLLISPTSLFDLEFRLITPWGAHSIDTPANLSRGVKTLEGQPGRELTWQLVPGELNQLTAVFWLPNPLGIGALTIGFLVILGRYIKYPQSSDKKVISVLGAETQPAETQLTK